MLSTWKTGATAPSTDPVIHLLQRFTYGPTPRLVAEVRAAGVEAWFEKQLNHQSIPDTEVEDFLSSWDMFNYVHKDLNFLWQLAESEGDESQGQTFQAHMMAGRILHLYTVTRQAHSKRQVFELMVDFWHNHLNITTLGDNTKDGHLDWNTNDWNKRVLREHALGRFEDLLQASAIHPAMIVYLDGELSTKELPNENYGRELLELHTVAPKAGYTQADVIDASRLFSGLRVRWPRRYYDRGAMPRLDSRSTLIDVPPFATMLHQERQTFGTFKVMGWQRTVSSPSEVIPAIQSLLNYLSTHPETAKTIAVKLGRRFVGDEPSQRFINDIASTYLASGTDIKATLRAISRHSDFKESIGTKLKRPGEDYVAAVRSLDVWPNFSRLGTWPGLTKKFAFVSPIAQWELNGMGHMPLAWPFPDGYPDVANDWVNANYQVMRWNIYSNFVRGGSWNQPTWDSLFPERQRTLEELVDYVSQRILFTPLGQADRASILRAITKVFGPNPDLNNSSRELGALIVRLIFQLPVWSLR
jgi:uncharacterized protein (DUF1800 family)